MLREFCHATGAVRYWIFAADAKWALAVRSLAVRCLESPQRCGFAPACSPARIPTGAGPGHLGNVPARKAGLDCSIRSVSVVPIQEQIGLRQFSSEDLNLLQDPGVSAGGCRPQDGEARREQEPSDCECQDQECRAVEAGRQHRIAWIAGLVANHDT